jgi:hypothetical protein
VVFYVKAEFGKIHTTLFPGAKEVIASVECAPTPRSYGRLATPIPLDLIPNDTEHQDFEDEKEAIFSTPSANFRRILDHIK